MDAFDAAEFALSELMPQKSRNIYMSQYERFMKWCSDKNVSKYTESVFLSYFYEESKRVTCSTLWSYYSMLKGTMAFIITSSNKGSFGKIGYCINLDFSIVSNSS